MLIGRANGASALATEGAVMAGSGSHAVVLGAGMAGLLTARVLSEFYESVTVVERDVLPVNPSQRKGVPQGRHLHNFLSRGTQLIGELFPGILDEFAAAGAVVDDAGDLSRIYVRVAGYELAPAGRLADPAPLAAYQASRPFMEFHLRRRVAALPGVTILGNHEVIEPVISGDAVTGVRIINHTKGIADAVYGDLVVDATGRAARTRAYLDSHGFGPPTEDRVPPQCGYSSQLLYIAPGRIAERMAFVSQGNMAPGALLVAYEHDTWMLAVASPIECGTPPGSFTELIDAAGQILPAAMTAALRDASPIGGLAISRNTAAGWRRYDRAPRLPSGYLVLGDALCNLNPLHGQGMTMAALQAHALRECLRAGNTNLARRFYCAAAEHITPVWTMNEAADRRPSPNTPRTLRHRARARMQREALTAATHDIAVAERFLRVRGLIDPPARLQDRALLVRILLTNFRQQVATRLWSANFRCHRLRRATAECSGSGSGPGRAWPRAGSSARTMPT
ncbi:FAD-dependent oxidoreductase [Mycolicibacterium komossense]|uniref:FAD-dependent oxidoreductase n=1 Tax=Mycolicibacterium komossense TaxID=1779 RepID=UPI0021F355C4|nr:FAD-dependent oxidoreductase [Mycolicibacterium komossense]